MTLRPSGPHRGHLPSPEPGGAAASSDPGDPSGLHSGRQDVVPLLRVVMGAPTAEELAALTVVVAAMSGRRERRRPTPVGAWASYADAHRQQFRPGPGGWRASGRFS